MSYTKVTDEERVGKGVTGLPDVPQLSTSDMQAKFDELGNVGIDALNNLIDELEATAGANSLGVTVPAGLSADPNVGSVVTALNTKANSLVIASHTHQNKGTLDAITPAVKTGYDRLVSVFQNINTVNNSVLDEADSIPTGHAIAQYISGLGGGDMLRSTYDANNDGVVDNASAVDGHTVTTQSSAITNPDSTTGTQIPTALAINSVYSSLNSSISGKIDKSSIATSQSTASGTVPSSGLLKSVTDALAGNIESLAENALTVVDRFDVTAETSNTVEEHSVHLDMRTLYIFALVCHRITSIGSKGARAGTIGLTMRYMDAYDKKVSGNWETITEIISQSIVAPNSNIVMTNDVDSTSVTVKPKVGYLVECVVFAVK